MDPITDTQLTRLEKVFDAIAKAWYSGGGSQPAPGGGGPMPLPGAGGALPSRGAGTESASAPQGGGSASGAGGPMLPLGVDTNSPFIRKMLAFSDSLEPSERDQLAVLLAAALATAKQVVQNPQNEQQRAAAPFLQALGVKLVTGGRSAASVGGAETTPATVTLTTTVTIAASHPWITC